MPPAVMKSPVTYRLVPDTANAETVYPPLKVEPRSVHVLLFHFPPEFACPLPTLLAPVIDRD